MNLKISENKKPKVSFKLSKWCCTQGRRYAVTPKRHGVAYSMSKTPKRHSAAIDMKAVFPVIFEVLSRFWLFFRLIESPIMLSAQPCHR